MPIGPPQSCPAKTTSANRSCVRTPPIQRTWLSNVCSLARTLLENPRPTSVGMIARTRSVGSAAATLR